MKGSDLTPKQMRAATQYILLRRSSGNTLVPSPEQKIEVRWRDLVMLVAEYGAIRAGSVAKGSSVDDPGEVLLTANTTSQVMSNPLNKLRRKWMGVIYRKVWHPYQLCFYCGGRVYDVKCFPEYKHHPNQASLDHFIPKSKGGSCKKHNLLLACRRCNEGKSCLDIEEYRAKLGGVIFFGELVTIAYVNRLKLPETKAQELANDKIINTAINPRGSGKGKKYPDIIGTGFHGCAPRPITFVQMN